MPRTDEAGLIERHVEKIVLLLTAVVLVPLLLVMWVFRSPYEIKLVPPVGVAMPRRAYRPEEVDQALQQMAQRVRELLEKQTPGSSPVRPWAEDIDRRFASACPGYRLTPLKAGGLALKPPEEIPVEKAKLAMLLPLPAPEKPKVAACREMVVAPLPAPPPGRAGAAAEGTAKGQEVKEFIAAHLVSVFDHGRLRQQWREALKKTRVVPTFVVLGVEVQRRQRLPGGRWGPPEPVSVFRVPAEPAGGAVVLPKFDGKNHDEVLAAAYQMADPQVRKWLLEPEYYNLYLHRQEVSWLVHKPRTRVSDLAGAVTPETPTARPRTTTPPRSWRREVPPGIVQPPRPVPPRRTIPRRTTPPRRGPGRYAVPPEDMYGPGGPEYRVPGRGVQPTAPPRRTRRTPPPERPTEPPERLVPARRVVQPRRPGPGTPPGAQPGAGVEVTSAVPDLEEQLNGPQGIFELWAHDISLDEAVAYSYRVRLVLLNPLFGRFKGVQKAADANKLQLLTPWSQWSEPVLVKRAAQFFLTGTNPQQEMVAVRVYSQKWGQVVAENFNVRRGEPIGRKVTMTLETFGGELKQTEVNFETGAVAVDFDFTRRVRVPNSSIVRNTTEMIYLDAEGRLRCRTLFGDQLSQRRRELEEQLAQTSASSAGPGRYAP